MQSFAMDVAISNLYRRRFAIFVFTDFPSILEMDTICSAIFPQKLIVSRTISQGPLGILTSRNNTWTFGFLWHFAIPPDAPKVYIIGIRRVNDDYIYTAKVSDIRDYLPRSRTIRCAARNTRT